MLLILLNNLIILNMIDLTELEQLNGQILCELLHASYYIDMNLLDNKMNEIKNNINTRKLFDIFKKYDKIDLTKTIPNMCVQLDQ